MMSDNKALNELFMSVLKKYKTPTGHYKVKRTIVMEHEDSGAYGYYTIELDEELNNVINEHDNKVFDGERLVGGCAVYEITPDQRYISISIGVALLDERQTNVENLSFYDIYQNGVYCQTHEFLPLSPLVREDLKT